MNRRTDGWLALACGIGAGLLYLRTLAPGLLFGDPAEFQVAAWLGGVAHPTGYPLYLILGWLWTHLLPLGTPAWRMNLYSAAWGAAAVGMTYLAATAMLRIVAPSLPELARRLIAVVSALMLATNPTFWSQAVIAEVYTLHALLTAGMLWLAMRSDDRRRSIWLAWLVGLGLAHHRTTLLWLPGILAWGWRGRASFRSLPYRWMLAGLVLPQLLYLYIPLRAPATPYLSVPLGPGETLALYDASPAGFLAFVLGQAFAGALRSPAQAWEQLPAAFTLLRENLGLAGLALALLGLVWLCKERRWRLIGLTGLLFLAQLVFNLFYGIGDVYVLYIPLYLVAALWAGVGLAALATLGARAHRRLAPVIPALGLIVPAMLVVHFAPLVDRSGDQRARALWETILQEPLPSASILVSNDRDEMVPLIYLQQVEGQRPDLTGLFPLMVRRPGWLNVGQVTQSALATGRPVFLIKPMPGLEVRFDLRSMGAVVRVAGAVEAPSTEPLGIFGDTLALLAVEVDPAEPQPGESLEVTLYWQPVRPIGADYTSFVHVLDGAGEKIAQHDAPPGGVYYPTSLWQPGEVLRDRHRVSLPGSLPAGPYALRIGLYRGPELTHLGEPLTVPWDLLTDRH